MKPLCRGLYRGRTSICSQHPHPHPRDQWVWAVVTGPVWQIDHDESQGWKPGSVTAGPVQRWRRPSETESTVDCPGPGPWAHEPLLCLGALPASVILPANPIPDQRPRRKKDTRRERRQRSEKGEWDWRACSGGGRERTTNHSLSDRRGSCSGRGTCVPAASLADAKLRPSARQCQTHEKLPWQHPRA